MGLFRFLLAMFVMLLHFSVFYPQALPHFIAGNASVAAFYTVSGFLIAFVLNTRYGDRLLLFYTNRILRIYPVYWIALAAFVLVNLLVVHGLLPHPRGDGIPDYRPYSALLWHETHPLNPIEAVMVALVNLMIVGRDILLYVGHWPGLGSPDYYYHFEMYVGPAWTIALELSFYAIAPFVVRNVGRIVLLMILSLGARLVGIALGRADFIESYSIFPLELVFFMAGSLSYHALPWLRAREPALQRTCCALSWGMIVGASLTYPLIPPPYGRVLFLSLVPFCLPGLFLSERFNPLDKVLGELSYPMYLLHPLLILVMVPGGTVLSELAAIGLVIALALGVVVLVERPIDRFRKARANAREIPSPRVRAAERTA